ncbi:class I SAM-dependent methyltransferase [Heliorestis convoluta]|uniref:Class I SAM-dependent methyltransferase n=2 Tax=Heliorestis convoluta TaxID=356322 RepID=A0A5Q2MVW9_9FIRM|nr:class I SAM-dependent methyltransferase [Heliorestis convoluta]
MTIQYYEEHGEAFYDATVHADLSALYKPFLASLPSQSHILDAGSGSGRDSRFFLDQGYEVTSIDASKAMVEKTTVLTGREALHLRFDQIEFENIFDGIWACASLLHVPPTAIDDVLYRLTRALREGGIMYCSFKYGEGTEYRGGRFFANYNERTWQEVLSRQKENPLKLLQLWKTQDVRPGRDEEWWLNCLVER